MADVAVRVTIPGGDVALRTLDQVRAKVQAVGQTSSASLTDTRQAAAQFSSALSSLSTVLRLTGQENTGFGQGLERGALALSAVTLVTQTLRGTLNALPIALGAVRAAMALLLGPVGLLIAAAAALGIGIGLLITRHRDASRAVDTFRDSVDDSRDSAKNAAFVYSQLATQTEFVASLSRRAAGEIRGISLATQGLLGPEVSFRQQILELEEEEAKKAKERRDRRAQEAKAARERQFQEETDVIVRFNTWQREQWEKAAQARQEAFLKASDAIEARQKQDQQVTTDLIRLANEQAITAIEEREREAIAAGQRMLEEERRRTEEAAAVNQAFSSSVKDQLVGILTGTATFADLWTSIWRQAVGKILEQIGLVQAAVAAIKFVFSIFGIFFQRGGEFIATRPTPIIVGEAGAERVSVRPLAGASAAGGTGMVFQFNAPVVWDDLTAAQFVRRHLLPALRREAGRSL